MEREEEDEEVVPDEECVPPPLLPPPLLSLRGELLADEPGPTASELCRFFLEGRAGDADAEADAAAAAASRWRRVIGVLQLATAAMKSLRRT